jgi:hypothetical protein
VRAWLVTVASLAAFVACTNSPFPGSAAAYLPDRVAAGELDRDTEPARAFARAFSVKGASTVVAAAVPGSSEEVGGGLPAVVIVAAEVDDDAAAARFERAAIRRTDTVRTEKIRGEQVRVATSEQADVTLHAAMWRPRDTIAVAVLAFDGKRAAARDAMGEVIRFVVSDQTQR